MRRVFQRSKLNELPSHWMINAPETKWTAYSKESSYSTNPNRMLKKQEYLTRFWTQIFSCTVFWFNTVNLLLSVTLAEKDKINGNHYKCEKHSHEYKWPIKLCWMLRSLTFKTWSNFIIDVTVSLYSYRTWTYFWNTTLNLLEIIQI